MFYNFVRAIARALFFFFGIKHKGLHNVPKNGGMIIASNHLSHWDPIVIALLLDRTVHFMAKEEFFRIRILAAFFSAIKAFPVKRGSADKKAIKKALEIIDNGGIVGIFPEGTRKEDGTQVEALAGTALIALKSNTPVLPVACIGTKRVFPIGWISPLKVIIGKPVTCEKYQGQRINSKLLNTFSKDIADEINLLLNNKEGF